MDTQLTEEEPMTFNPKFSSFRTRIVLLAILFAVAGGAVLLAGHDSCHRGRHDLALAGILALAAVIPESPAKKPQAEKYSFTPGP
jgi:hypothetical protein